MLVHVSTEQRHVEVLEVDELRSFSVVVDGDLGDSELAVLLEPLGRLETSEHAWISIAGLRVACGRTTDDRWSTDFDAMVAYAASRGWVDETGTELRAHVERSAR